MAVSPRHALEMRDADKSAESLFESQSIAQIREVRYVQQHATYLNSPLNYTVFCQVETKARTDIEDKKQQLRQLVGSSYRYADHVGSNSDRLSRH